MRTLDGSMRASLSLAHPHKFHSSPVV
jgi:hypothetical protein